MLMLIQACWGERELVPRKWDWSEEYLLRVPPVYFYCALLLLFFIVNVVTFKKCFCHSFLGLGVKGASGLSWVGYYNELL